AERLDQARLADDVRRCDSRRDLVVRDPARDDDAGTALELCAQRAVADEGERPGAAAESRERVGKAEHVLPPGQRAEAEESRPAVPVGSRREGEAVEVDAAVHDLDLPARLGKLVLELAPEIRGDGDDRGRSAND